jgi:hypothetical protein
MRVLPGLKRWLVDKQPKEAELRHLGGELLELHRFADEGVRAELVGFRDVALLLRRGQNDDRKQLQRITARARRLRA